MLDVSPSANGPAAGDIRALTVLLRHTFRRNSNDAISTRDGQAFCRAADLRKILLNLNVSLADDEMEYLASRCLEIHAHKQGNAGAKASNSTGMDWVPAYSSAARRTDRGGNNSTGPSSAEAPLIYDSDLVAFFWAIGQNKTEG